MAEAKQEFDKQVVAQSSKDSTSPLGKSCRCPMTVR